MSTGGKAPSEDPETKRRRLIAEEQAAADSARSSQGVAAGDTRAYASAFGRISPVGGAQYSIVGGNGKQGQKLWSIAERMREGQKQNVLGHFFPLRNLFG